MRSSSSPPFSPARRHSGPAAGVSRRSVGWKLVRPELHPDLSDLVRGLLTERIRDAHVLVAPVVEHLQHLDRKSTRLNSSHVRISYAVFCLKKRRRVVLRGSR